MKTQFAVLLLLAALLGACSESSVSLSGSSASVASISESSSSPSKFSSDSKKSVPKEKLPYLDDIANLTYSVIGSSMTAAEFPNAIQRTAATFKISNWSQEQATFEGIGKGLKRAGIKKEDILKQPVLADVLKTNSKAQSWIEAGFSL